jgi:NhaA family Na+:H+ antiporter
LQAQVAVVVVAWSGPVAVPGVGVARELEAGAEEAGVSDRQQAAAHTLEAIAERIQTPAQRLEHSVTPWATYLILPLFALANAGVGLSGNIVQALTNPVSLDILVGLVLGKSLGITLFSWLAAKTGVAEMPARVTWRQLFSATWLASIGFTVALFISNSAFADPSLLATAKISIRIASLLSATVGVVLLLVTTSQRVGATKYRRAEALA